MDEKQFEVLSKKLDSLTKLLAFNIIRDKKTVSEQIDALTKAGLKASEIAVLVDRTENQVYVTQNMLRKAKKKDQLKEEPPVQSSTQEETKTSV